MLATGLATPPVVMVNAPTAGKFAASRTLSKVRSSVLLALCAAKDWITGAVASTVNASAVETALTLPAASVCLTVTDLAPSPVTVRLVPVPAVNAPPFTLYCQLAPASSPVTLTVPTLVIRSVLTPLFVAIDKLGALATASKVKASAVETALTLPAASVCLTVTDLAPSPVTVRLVPVPAVNAPPFTLYCQLAPASSPVTLTVPTLVLASPDVPLSVAKARVGAMGAVVSVVLAGASDDDELAAPATAKPATTAATTAPADTPPAATAAAAVAELDAAPAPAAAAPSVATVDAAALAACAKSKGRSASALAAPAPAICTGAPEAVSATSSCKPNGASINACEAAGVMPPA